jgi:hypothetical protein
LSGRHGHSPVRGARFATATQAGSASRDIRVAFSRQSSPSRRATPVATSLRPLHATCATPKGAGRSVHGDRGRKRKAASGDAGMVRREDDVATGALSWRVRGQAGKSASCEAGEGVEVPRNGVTACLVECSIDPRRKPLWNPEDYYRLAGPALSARGWQGCHEAVPSSMIGMLRTCNVPSVSGGSRSGGGGGGRSRCLMIAAPLDTLVRVSSGLLEAREGGKGKGRRRDAAPARALFFQVMHAASVRGTYSRALSERPVSMRTLNLAQSASIGEHLHRHQHSRQRSFLCCIATGLRMPPRFALPKSASGLIHCQHQCSVAVWDH